ncbi:tRNA glutamyl-Q(34) synthetase GluQRS, partial [Klebsiella pneumoniae]
LRFLNQAIPEEWQALSIDDLLVQAVANWQPAKIEHSQMAPAEL